ncbi:hypothetical protein C2845_PM03G13690 [Panicum miliaceum]|uniref:Uncharacterized protein n=1 Tax=Panicum miliaceum TaxID=4540 RepID=A0A3L6TCV4_PANMI|nr:hypothetical protein C2845_PM03G13690 [Panicum miliaceum]
MRALLLFHQLPRSPHLRPASRGAAATRALAFFAARPLGSRARARPSSPPPQQQGSQPGKEHAMDPRPEAIVQNYKSAEKLKGKVALVTGGDSGIGRAVCLCFALEGATGHEDRDAKETLQALRGIRSRTGARDPMAVPADLGYEENCRRVVEEVAGAYGGRIDVLVNNAAEQYERPSLTEVTEADLDRFFRTNIFFYFLVIKHAVRHMAEGGSIINSSSVNAYKGNKTLLDYTATKGAIVAFTRALALQLAEKGIRVNGVAPGPVRTPPIPASFGEEKVGQFGSEVPMKRAGQTAEVAPSYVCLSSSCKAVPSAGLILETMHQLFMPNPACFFFPVLSHLFGLPPPNERQKSHRSE